MALLTNWFFYLVIMTMMLIFVVFYYSNNVKKLKKNLEKLRLMVNEKSKLSLISKELEEEEYLDISIEIESNIIENDGEEESIKNFNKIFTLESFLYPKININILNEFPQIFLSIGILGTFIGLSIGLSHLSSVDFSNISTNTDLSNNIGGLLNSVKTSFISSILGILFSIVTKIILEKYEIYCYNLIKNLNNLLNRTYYKSSAEKELIQKIKKDLSHTLEKVLSENISVLLEENLEIVNDLSDRINNQNIEVKKSTELFIEKLSNLEEIFRLGFKRAVSELFDETFIVKMKEIQKNIEEQFIFNDKTLNNFNSYMTKITNESKEASINFKEVSSELKENNTNLFEFFENHAKENQKLISTTKELNEYMNDAFTPLENITSNLEKLLSENNECLVKFTDNLNNLPLTELENTIQNLDETTEGLTESVDEISESVIKIKDSSKNIVDEFKEIPFHSYIEEHKAITKTLSEIKEEYSELSDVINETIEPLDKINNNLNELLSENNKTLTQFTENLSNIPLDKLEGTLNKFDSSLENLSENTEVLNESVENISDSILKIKDSNNEIITSNLNVSKEFKNIPFKSYTEEHNKILEELSVLSEEYREISETIEKNNNNLKKINHESNREV